ncbi:hypothetical protein ACEPPN_018917 [Leptodophora sp. 'Broadleaf-Isolate-01']
MALDPHVHEFYRMFEAPGIQHCSYGNGGQPTSTFDAMVAWVENGIVPESLPVSSTSNGTIIQRSHSSGSFDLGVLTGMLPHKLELMDRGAFAVVVSTRQFSKAVPGGCLDEGNGDGTADFAEFDNFFVS